MKTYNIKKVSASPDWSAIPSLEIDERYFDTPSDIHSKAQIAYGEDRLYVHLSVTEPETRAVETGPFGSPCEDSCLEFFFSPMEGDKRYFNIEYNSLGCVWCGFGSSVADLIRLHPESDPLFSDTFSPKIDVHEGGWDIEYTVPFEFIRRFFPDFQVYEGKKIRANCYKCSDLATPANYLSWSPIVGEPFKYHRPECFGEMIFSK